MSQSSVETKNKNRNKRVFLKMKLSLMFSHLDFDKKQSVLRMVGKREITKKDKKKKMGYMLVRRGATTGHPIRTLEGYDAGTKDQVILSKVLNFVGSLKECKQTSARGGLVKGYC